MPIQEQNGSSHGVTSSMGRLAQRPMERSGTTISAEEAGAIMNWNNTRTVGKTCSWMAMVTWPSEPSETTGGYTSGRLKTQGRFSVRYGKIEARVKLPYGPGIWPAFWILGENILAAGWPNCGEIDIMENIGTEPSIVHGTVHGPGYSGGKGVTAQAAVRGKGKLSDRFHVFAVAWSSESIIFYLDRKLYARVTRASIPAGTPWAFDQPFFLLLNLAVGGDWPGKPDSATRFPQTMLVDWVRVWKPVEPGREHQGRPLVQGLQIRKE